MRIACFTAHPDYTGLCIGGTVARHAQKGDEVYVYSLTPGELGIATLIYPDRPREECVEIKSNELIRAAKVLGAKEASVLNFPDANLKNTPELRLAIAGIIRKVKPDVVITHWPNDAHPDMRDAGQAVLDACLTACLAFVKLPDPVHVVQRAFCFSSVTSIDFVANVFVDITDVVDLKVKAFTEYKTLIDEIKQVFAGDRDDKWTEYLLGPNLFWGQESGVLYAEGFREIKIPGLMKRALPHLPIS